MYTVDYFINKFEAIPESLWAEGCQGVQESELKSPHCALGHCLNDEGYFGNALVGNSVEAAHLVKIVERLDHRIDKDIYNYLLVDINNGDDHRFNQPTSKQRVLAALRDIKDMQSKGLVLS